MADEIGSRTQELVDKAPELIKKRGRKRKTADVGHLYKAAGSWHVRFYTGVIREDGTREQKSRKLGPATMSKNEAATKRNEYLKPRITSRGITHSNMTVREYYDQRIIPMWDGISANGGESKSKQLKPSTVDGYKKLWTCYIEKPLGNVRIGDYTTVNASQFLESLANKGLNAHTVSHVRSVVNIIFSHAVSKGVISSNPFLEAKSWVKPKEVENYKPFTPQQVRDVLVGLRENLQALTAVGLCYFCALRPGEAAAARWENYTGTHLTITQSSWRGRIGTPKTKESAQTIEVPEPCQEILRRLHEAEGKPSVGFILHGSKDQPLSFDYLTRTVIKPILEAKKIAWHPIKYFRNDAASHISDMTRDGLAAASLLRHKTPATTDSYYAKIMEAAKTRAREALEAGYTATSEKLLTSGDSR